MKSPWTSNATCVIVPETSASKQPSSRAKFGNPIWPSIYWPSSYPTGIQIITNNERPVPCVIPSDRSYCDSAWHNRYVPTLERIERPMNVDQEQPAGVNVPVDFSATLCWVDGDRALLAELIEIFLEDCPRRLHELEQAVTEGNTILVKQTAHSLKGMVACLAPNWPKDLRLRWRAWVRPVTCLMRWVSFQHCSSNSPAS